MEKEASPNFYDIIAEFWGIPRHRVKYLITAGAYGVAGAGKTTQQWHDQLHAYDEHCGAPALPPPAPKKGRFVSNLKDLMGGRK